VTASQTPPSPYQLVFGAQAMDDTLFPPIAAEAEARDNPLHDPDRFLFLSSVGHLLNAIVGTPTDGDDGDDGEGGRAGEAFRQHGRLVYHAFHFWREGKHEIELDQETVRRVLDQEVVADDRALSPPAAAGYLRLPRNLVWASPEPGARPEPADGIFWVLEPRDADGPALHLLLALGVRADRPGFSVVTATGVGESAPHWANVDARPGDVDFTTTLPGGELDRLYSVETTAELLKLASRCFLALDAHGG
jgi:hypothetical protein